MHGAAQKGERIKMMWLKEENGVDRRMIPTKIPAENPLFQLSFYGSIRVTHRWMSCEIGPFGGAALNCEWQFCGFIV